MGIRVGIDTGGTFTDLVAVEEETGEWHLSKVPSNPADPVEPVVSAIEGAGFDPAQVEFVVIGTTIGINAVLTRGGARVVYLTTEGFDDIPYIQRISRKNHYDFRWRKPTPLADRPDCIGVEERLDEEGAELVPLNEDQLERVADWLAEGDGDVAVAVCYLFSYLNPEHELRTREFLQARAPELAVSVSHEVAPIWREYERGTSVIVDAYLKPLLDEYVGALSEAFNVQGVSSPWAVLKSNGGHAAASEARARPSHLLLSGIAGGAIGGAVFTRKAQREHAIVLDMGGTSCDVCLILDGEALYSSEYEIEYGLPVSVPSVSTRTIGAGGGSIGWVDPGGFLQVGPQSAGADPGPACYGYGGEEATLTDANLTLGRLNPEFFLGGKLRLDERQSTAALETLAHRLGVDPLDAATSMVRIANENMANAIRLVTVEQGIDPRELALVTIGGAGPTHGAEIASSLGIDRVLVPPNPGLCSAFGVVAAQVRVDVVQSIHLVAERATPEEVNALFAELESRARADFVSQASHGEEAQISRSIAMRYQGQNYEEEIPIASGELTSADLDEAYENYHRRHDDFYGYRFDGIPIELVRLAIVVSGAEVELPPLTEVGDTDGAAASKRQVHFPEHGFLETEVMRRSALATNGTWMGPVIIESMDSTIVVPPEWRATATRAGLIELDRQETA